MWWERTLIKLWPRYQQMPFRYMPEGTEAYCWDYLANMTYPGSRVIGWILDYCQSRFILWFHLQSQSCWPILMVALWQFVLITDIYSCIPLCHSQDLDKSSENLLERNLEQAELSCEKPSEGAFHAASHLGNCERLLQCVFTCELFSWDLDVYVCTDSISTITMY